MTNKEAMIELGRYYEEGIRPSEEAIKHIIHVLQNTDDDCISRQAVLNIVNFEDKWLLDAKGHNSETEIAFSGMKSRIADLPSVTLQETKWIPVSERLPEDGEYVLIFYSNGDIRIAYYYIDTSFYETEFEDLCETGWYNYTEEFMYDQDVIAWQPLPEPYKEEGDKEWN